MFRPATPTRPSQLTMSDMDNAGNYGRICGTAEGNLYTLDGCFQIRHTNVLSDQPGEAAETIRVSTIAEGVHLGPDEPIETHRIDARLLHLAHWFGGAIPETWTLPDATAPRISGITLQGQPTLDQTVSIEDGKSLRIHETYAIEGNRVTERTLRRDLVVEISGLLGMVEDYLVPLSMLGDLVSMGTQRTCTVESLQLYHPNRAHHLPSGGMLPIPTTYHAAWTNWDARDPTPIEPHQLLFTAMDLGGPDAIARWCNLTEHRDLLSRVMATRYRPGFPSDQLLNCAAALEALDKALHRDRLGFRNRMRRLLDDAGPVFQASIGDGDRWAGAITRARNDAAHHTDREIPERGARDYALAQTAYYLFAATMLGLADAEQSAIAKVGNNSQLRRWATQY